MRAVIFLLTLAWGLFTSSPACTAQTDSLVVQTEEVADSLVTLREINRGPKKALLWSIIPGGGQVYNKRWWKVPVVYTGLLGIIAVADFNQRRYVRFREALTARCLGEDVKNRSTCVPEGIPGFPLDAVTDTGLIQARDNADRGRQQAWFGILAVYLLQGIEAYTDAQLMEFDIDDDLSLRVQPTAGGAGGMGVGLVVSFK